VWGPGADRRYKPLVHLVFERADFGAYLYMASKNRLVFKTKLRWPQVYPPVGCGAICDAPTRAGVKAARRTTSHGWPTLPSLPDRYIEGWFVWAESMMPTAPAQSRPKGEQQGGAVVVPDVERACLGVAQPAFRYQILEERMEAGLAHAVRLGVGA
jgi:hypothetical protein